jgi:2',3'-cyclic-nucleotide 2'-phosphodiesterase (5'-nucleotidase family)
MGNMVADAMRGFCPGVEASITNSGGLRQDIRGTPPSSGGEAVNEVTWGEVFAVLPFGNRTVIETITGQQLTDAVLNGLQPTCNPTFAGGTGRSPQVSGIKITYTCSTLPPGPGSTPSVTGLWKSPDGPAGPLTPIGPTDTIRIVTNDFMYFGGGDGYTALGGGTDVLVPGDALLDLTIGYIADNSPVAPVIDGRIVGP